MAIPGIWPMSSILLPTSELLQPTPASARMRIHMDAFPEEDRPSCSREVGWGNAMRYILTEDHWSAEEAYRMGEVQKVAPDAKEALEAGIRIANKIADCGPLGIKTSLASAHLAIDHTGEEALSKLDAQFGALFHTQDFLEGRKAEAEGRKPVYQGK